MTALGSSRASAERAAALAALRLRKDEARRVKWTAEMKAGAALFKQLHPDAGEASAQRRLRKIVAVAADARGNENVRAVAVAMVAKLTEQTQRGTEL